MKRMIINLAILITLLSFFPAVPNVGGQNVSLVSRYRFNANNAISVQESYAYFVADGHWYFGVMDISNPTNPRLVDTLSLGANGHSLVIGGQYAYVANGPNGLKIISIASPANPHIVGSLPSSGYAIDLSVALPFVYLIENGSNYLRVIDVANPQTPELVGSCNIGFSRGIFVQDTYAYIANEHLLKIVDITNPFNPIIIASVDPPGSSDNNFGIYVKEDYAYLCAGEYGVQIFDISSRDNPIFVTQYNLPAQSQGIYGDSNNVYVVGWELMSILDISNPIDPVFAGGFPAPAWFDAVTCTGPYIYLGAQGMQYGGFCILLFQPGFGAIEGMVRNNLDGEPARGVSVIAQPDGYSDTTDADGRFLLDGLYNINYSLSFSHPDFFDSLFPAITVISGDTLPLDITLRHKPMNDVSVSSLISPRGKLIDNIDYTVISEIINIGTNAQTFDILVNISIFGSLDPVYSDTARIIDMPDRSVDTIAFSRSFRPLLDTTYFLVMYTNLPGDQEPLNDTLRVEVKSIGHHYLIYGNRDGAPIPAVFGSTIEIPVWGATANNDYSDSAVFMHIPLSSDTTMVSARLGGYFADTLVGRWDDHSFIPPQPDLHHAGWTTQCIWAMDCLFECHRERFFWTNGDTVPIGTFRMQLSENLSSMIGDTINPFQEGFDQRDGGLMWGMSDGITGIVPLATYPRLLVLGPSNCHYLPGDINSNGVANGVDVIFGVNYLKYGGVFPPDSCDCPYVSFPFYAAGDVNGSCSFNGIDIGYMINFLKGIGPEFVPCPYCPPAP